MTPPFAGLSIVIPTFCEATGIQESVSAKHAIADEIARGEALLFLHADARFVRRPTFEALGGFRPLPLFEDYDLARRLPCAGRTRYLRQVPITASARRFAATPGRTLLLWTALQVLYTCGYSPQRLAALYRDCR